MTERTVFSVSIGKKIADRLDRIAAATQRTRSALARQAIEEFVEEQERVIAQIREGLADVRAGRVAYHADVLAWAESLGTDRELPLPQSRKS